MDRYKKNDLIKRFESQQLDEIMSIWLNTNISAHPFIDKSYWEDAADTVKPLLPSSDLFIYQENGIIQGFIGITDRTYIAGLFVSENCQSRGVGRKLLDYCKKLYTTLELDVFVENTKAVHFYQKNGFITIETKINPDFMHKEHHMIWLA